MPAGGREAAQISQPPRAEADQQAAPPGGTGPGAGRGWRAWLPGLAGVLGPAAVALAVNGYRLGSLSLWRDEAYSLEAARRTPGQIFALLRHTDAVNSAYYLLLHVFIVAFGSSGWALRLPSVLAMAAAAGVTAATGRRLARLAALPGPAVTGAAAGLFVAAAPMVTRYAQDARSYAIVTMMAAAASYLLLRALTDPRWRWWAGYGLALAVAGLCNLLALLLVAAHAVTVLAAVARRRQPAPPGAPALAPRPWRWLAAAAAAGVVLSPLLLTGYAQRGQIGWLGRPGLQDAVNLAASFAGSRLLVLPVAVLALAGLAGPVRVPLPPAALALPWLIVPPVILLAVSQVHPAYDARYVLYCLPALGLLVAAGLAWLAQLTARTPLAAVPGGRWLPALAAGAALAALLVSPQQQIRLPSSRADNLRAASAILAARERSGDAVFYLPPNMRVMSLGYPAPWRRLRDVTLARSPVAAANLIGTTVPPGVLRQRFAGVTRVWLVTGNGGQPLPKAATPIEKTERALIAHWHLAGRWFANDVGLRLYQRP